jgi:hypothetical protein
MWLQQLPSQVTSERAIILSPSLLTIHHLSDRYSAAETLLTTLAPQVSIASLIQLFFIQAVVACRRVQPRMSLPKHQASSSTD